MIKLWSLLLLFLPLGCIAQSCSPDCSSKATCVAGECLCDDGYAPLADSTPLFCADVDECASGAAECDAEFGYCVDYDPPIKFRCGCLPGYVCQDLPGCKTCVVDTSHPCNINNGGCDATETCTPLANNGTVCSSTVDLTDISPTNAPFAACTTVNEPGSIQCDLNTTTCDDSDGTPKCVCNSGFLGISGNCVDIDECRSLTANNCTEGRSVCVNLPGSYRCQCATNFTDFPGSIRGTDCRTAIEIDLALQVGSFYSVATGLSGITAADMAPGAPARVSIINYFADKFNIEASAVTISNVTQTTSRRMRENSRGLQISAIAFVIEFRVTSDDIVGTTFETTTTTASGSTTVTTFVDPETVAATIEAKVDEIVEFFEVIDATSTDGNNFAVNEEEVDAYIEEVIAFLEEDNVDVDEAEMRDTNVVGLTYVDDLVSFQDVAAQEVVDSGIDNEFVQALQDEGFSGTPTVAPSATNRFLGAEEEEEDFFGDFATSACRCVDCDLLSGCEDIWRGGEAMTENTVSHTETHVVVDHCVDDLSWIPAFLSDVRIASITIVSRCGKAVDSPFADADILSFDHVAGSNGVFLLWIVDQYDEDMTGTVLFLEDYSQTATSGAHLVKMAERTSFACSASSSSFVTHSDELGADSKSAYCRTDSLEEGFWDEIGLGFEEELVQVCDSRTFATSWESIHKKKKSLWESLANHASHVTKEWGALLAQPLVGQDLESVLQYSNEEVDGCLYHKAPRVEEQAAANSFGVDFLRSFIKW